LGRFLTIDPLSSKYISFTPYAFAINRPIQGIDYDGKGWEPTNTWNGKLTDEGKKFAERNGIYTEGMTYVDLWKLVGPDLVCQTQHSKQKTDCADVSIKCLITFAEQFKLPVKVGDVSHNNKGDLDKLVKKAQDETGAEQLFDGKGTTSGTVFTKAMFDEDPIGTEKKMRDAFANLAPGDLVTWNHTAPGQTGHNITVTDVHPDEGSIETIQGQPGEIPQWDDKDIETMIGQVKSGSEEIRFHKWDHKGFDKSAEKPSKK
jgi:hypothetical protein